MKSQINLLHDEFIPKFEWVCASHFVAVIIVSLLIGSGFYGLVTFNLQAKEREVANLKREISTQQKTIDELSVALSSRVRDPLLDSKLASFTEQTKTRSILLNHIRNLSSLKQRSFSGLFDSLSQSNSTDLWLTEFLVTADELNIEGLLAQPKALPLWIKELSQTDFFKGQEFNVASVSREEEALIFKLNSVQKTKRTATANIEVVNEG